MKIKLLKKVKKRFQIIHLPNGFCSFGDTYNYNLFKLSDKKDTYKFRDEYAQLGRILNQKKQFVNEIFDTEEDCIYYLKSLIIVRLKKEGFIGIKDKKRKLAEKKVWSK